MDMRSGKVAENLILTICLITFALSVLVLLDRFLEQRHYKSEIKVLKELVYGEEDKADMTVKDRTKEHVTGSGENLNARESHRSFSEIRKLNPDFIGWIEIPGTQVDYPVMQSVQEPEFYIRRNFKKEKSVFGSIFADASCNIQTSKNVILYGHHMKDGSMFALLDRYDSKSFYNSNKYLHFDTIYQTGSYEILGAFRISANIIDDQFIHMLSCDTRENFTAFIQYIKRNGFYDTGVTASYEDHLVTLATCQYVDKNGRFFLVAKKHDE